MENALTTLLDSIFTCKDDNFNNLALQVFHYQYQHNVIYQHYINVLKVNINEINTIEKIPFLPISFFKTHTVITGKALPTIVFESSGTTGMQNSKHYISDVQIYERSFLQCFQQFFGDMKKYCIIGLLPSYLERNNSSLVYMVNDLVVKSAHPKSGFYLNEYEKLASVLQQLEEAQQPTILFGVTFALLDFAEKKPMPLHYVQIIETGGMKGRHIEMTRQEVHQVLKKAFAVPHIYSEYGMTELLSQAYLQEQQSFVKPTWLKALVRDINDPFDIKTIGKGAINIIDLANIHSCSFIATDDVGEVFANENFTIDGRLDSSDLRGCSLMAI